MILYHGPGFSHRLLLYSHSLFLYLNRVSYSQNLIISHENKRLGNFGERLWIGKPPDSCQGRGIVITKDISQFSQYLLVPKKTQMEKLSPLRTEISTQRDSLSPEEEIPGGWIMGQVDQSKQTLKKKKKRSMIVIQEYIQNPLLICGHKFDLRLYVLVTSFHPLKVYIYRDGLVRFCTKPYSQTDLDPLRHLTNSAISKKVIKKGQLTMEEMKQFVDNLNSEMGNSSDFAKRSLKNLMEYLSGNGVDTDSLWREICSLVNLTLVSLLPCHRGSHRSKSFELFGFDVLLTEDYRAHLIEVNQAPSLAISCKTDSVIKKVLFLSFFLSFFHSFFPSFLLSFLPSFLLYFLSFFSSFLFPSQSSWWSCPERQCGYEEGGRGIVFLKRLL
eukprot:TRINITY_DN1480_c1_g1_i23.p1 TRINITY_DN1480_c1_g1~~TRINITY_DN1480_c1_g1_i23.p1  ORF type:complete len:386 (+),score=57.38 TRINITY_DN1480_c1_g1_i23:319-1476(+)